MPRREVAIALRMEQSGPFSAASFLSCKKNRKLENTRLPRFADGRSEQSPRLETRGAPRGRGTVFQSTTPDVLFYPGLTEVVSIHAASATLGSISGHPARQWAIPYIRDSRGATGYLGISSRLFSISQDEAPTAILRPGGRRCGQTISLALRMLSWDSPQLSLAECPLTVPCVTCCERCSICGPGSAITAVAFNSFGMMPNHLIRGRYACRTWVRNRING